MSKELVLKAFLHLYDGHDGLRRFGFGHRVHEPIRYPEDVRGMLLSQLQDALAVMLDKGRGGNDHIDTRPAAERLLDHLYAFDQERLFLFSLFRVRQGPKVFYGAVLFARDRFGRGGLLHEEEYNIERERDGTENLIEAFENSAFLSP